ncbi:MAG TPA: tRNA uridine(34) 5-carboxymethylaminomethyl modification radical SAM/GNAT enzyme Elp3 [Candidatus Nealsonbacteria bacterium]|uniref:Radical SAM core domain-containing protein n=1 Tax=marine sediment metagenome TaxID=412755 RepID=A0A0F9UZB1_9ZZZZ|nr:tRNA uridine(34) 5-carboxymethylaminomethyl modification radical SAM/GNAT enzyme Elp3 [Candidatus Nealsonbacteria bacterium]HEB46308.1 tRNA uridine(34) 5-carboxymethylaminomethyl modification radical SAM/GNAT enzyme Elp3 [Candidatus Nealsonbacteria bacterium]
MKKSKLAPKDRALNTLSARPTRQAVKELIKARVKTLADLAKVKRKIAKKYKTFCLANVELLKAYHKLLKGKRIKENKILEELLRIRRVRSLSGIAVISVLTKPYPCPGHCLYCPTQDGIPKSYLDNEPAVMRAILNKFDPYLQVKTRLKSLKLTGHPTDKIELIVIGGTWSYLPRKYQAWFVKRCFDACNKYVSKNLERAQKINERAKHRIIGITLETRPDYINKKEIERMRKLGATRVEMGVQSLYDNVLKINQRDHKVETVIKATKLLKDAGFKICYHMMPNLPGSDLKKDKKMFQELFSNPDFQPDLLKIYPCVVLKEAQLYKLWQVGQYKPYNIHQLIKLLKNIKKRIPYYCRIQRLIRDIPSQSIIAGCKTSNLRQIIFKDMKKEGWKCRCIRCREIREAYDPKTKLYLFRKDYDASGGKEIFLSYEEKNRKKLYSLLRLRIPSCVPPSSKTTEGYSKTSEGRPSQKHFLPVLQNAAIIREVHTYGQLVPISESKTAPQHRGLGKKLIKTAEKIVYTEFGRSAKNEFGFRPHTKRRQDTKISKISPRYGVVGVKKIAVISGVGVRNYWRKLGYQLENDYMVKNL